MHVLIRRKGGKWVKANERPYDHEAHLQKMLYESPELIPLPKGNSARVFVREAGLPGSGSTDLLGVEGDGSVYIVECKLADNPEVRRKVIGQILEYASYLWEMTLEEFDAIFVEREEKSLEDLFLESKVEGWSFEVFREKVTQNLKSGTFSLIIVVDKINDELERIISYVSSRSANLRLQAVELRLFREGDTEVLLPQLHGHEGGTEPPRIPKIPIDEFLRRCEEKGTREKMQSLLDEWHGLGNSIEPGTSGISFRTVVGDRPRYIFWGYPSTVIVSFSGLVAHGAPEQVVEDLRRQLATMPGFEKRKVLSQKEPRAHLAKMSQVDISSFVRLIQGAVKQWQESTSPTA
jgi:hypothetical protein